MATPPPPTPAEREAAFHRTRRELGRTLLFWALLGALGTWWLGLFEPQKEIILCDAESTGLFRADTALRAQGEWFGIGGQRSTAQAFSGGHSILLSPENPYGFSYRLRVRGYERFTVRVWRRAPAGRSAEPGVLVAAVGQIFWKSGRQVVERRNGWEQLEFSFELPFRAKDKTLQIFCWNSGSYPLWFDDLEIRIDRSQRP